MSVRENEFSTEIVAPLGFSGKHTLWETLTGEKYYKWTLIIPLLLVLAYSCSIL
jgi:hypothetical protein